MARKTHEVVRVTVHEGTLKCDPEWVHLYWNDGPEHIRWTFSGAPKEAVGATVEFHEKVPAKYPTDPGTPGGFRPRGVHRGVGHDQPTSGSHLPDLVTSGNTREHGYFYYDVKLLDGAGKVIAQADPGGDNQPAQPPPN